MSLNATRNYRSTSVSYRAAQAPVADSEDTFTVSEVLFSVRCRHCDWLVTGNDQCRCHSPTHIETYVEHDYVCVGHYWTPISRLRAGLYLDCGCSADWCSCDCDDSDESYPDMDTQYAQYADRWGADCAARCYSSTRPWCEVSDACRPETWPRDLRPRREYQCVNRTGLEGWHTPVYERVRRTRLKSR